MLTNKTQIAPISIVYGCLVVFFTLAAAATNKINFHADSVVLNGQNEDIEAAGNVFLQTPQIQLNASTLHWDSHLGKLRLSHISHLKTKRIRGNASKAAISLRPLNISIHAFNIWIQTHMGQIQIEGHHALCTVKRCHLREVAIYPCPASMDTISINSSLVHYTPSKTRLIRPKLRIANHTVFVLPRLTLLPPSRPGFLFWKLQWSPTAGLNVGPRVYLPLGNSRFAVSHTAIRTKGGFDSSLHIEGNEGFVELHQLYTGTQNSFMSQMHMRPQLHSAVAAIDTHLSSNKFIIDDSTFLARQRAITHTESQARIAIHHSSLFIENTIQLRQHFPSQLSKKPTTHTEILSLGASVFGPVASVFPIESQLHLSIDRTLVQSDFPTLSESDLTNTRFVAGPKLTLPFRLGAFQFQIGTGLLSHRRHFDKNNSAISSTTFGASANISSPFWKRMGNWIHLVTPKFQYQISPWSSGSPLVHPSDGWDMVQKGQQLNISIENRLGRSLYAPLLVLTPAYHAIYPAFRQDDNRHVTSLTALINAPLGETALKVGMEWPLREISFIEATFRTPRKMRSGVSSSIFFYRKNAPTPLRIQTHVQNPWFYQPPLIDEDILTGSNHIFFAFSQHVFAGVGVQMEFFPIVQLSELFYHLEITTKCNCIKLNIQASHIPNQAFPKMMATVSFQN